MRFLVDAQLPPALAKAISASGHPASHVFDLGLVAGEDRVIWSKAASEKSVIVTKDEDFVQLRKRAKSGPAVVWLRVGNTANSFLIPWFVPLIPQIEEAIEGGDALIELWH